MALPGLLYFLIFHYGPMYGLMIAFKDFNLYKGVFESKWVGLDNFATLFGMSGFQRALRNTVIIATYQLLFVFPAPIVLSLLIHEVVNVRYKKFVQTSVYLPHFVSWVVIGGILYAILSPTSGVVKEVASWFGYEGPVANLMASREHFRGLLILSSIWKEAGFGTVLYLATMLTIDPHLYEAAKVDGAKKWRQIWHITLPSIRSTIVVLLILRLGQGLDVGFEQIFLMLNPFVRDVGEILDTYVYEKGIRQSDVSFATAVGLFKGLVGLVLVVTSNRLAKRFGEQGLY